MSAKTTKRRFFGYFPFDYKAFEQELAEELAAGWQLTAFNRFSVVYTKTEQRDLTPFIDVFTGAYESDGEKKLAAYRKKRRNAGWKAAGELDFFYVWYLPAGEKAPEVSVEAERNLNQRMVWSRELSVLGIAGVVLVLGLVAVWKMAYTDLLTFTGVGSVAMFPLFLLPILIIGFLTFRDVGRARRPLRAGELLPVPSIRDARRRYRLIWGLAAAIAVFVALLFILDGLFGYSRYISLLLPVVVASLSVWGLSKLENARIRKPLTFVIVAICGVLLFTLQAYNPFGVRETAPEDMRIVLTMDADAPVTAYRRTVSPMVPEHYTYTESVEKRSAQNEYFRIPADFARRIVLAKVLDAMAGTGEVSEIDPEAWNADRAWRCEDEAVLLERGTEILFYKETDAEGAGVRLTPERVG